MGYKFIDGNIEMFRGNTAEIPLIFNFDITGAIVYFRAKSSLDNATYDVNVSQSVHSDPTNGITQIDLGSTDTNITAGNYIMSIEIVLTDISGETVYSHTIYPNIEDKTAYLVILDRP
jgi:hypothetical protein